MELRHYQQKAIDELRAGYHQGHRCQILQLPTGGGKTMIASSLLKSAKENGNTGYFVVDKIVLIDQAVAHLESVGLRVGVIQADHPQFDPGADVFVCSVQTLARRRLPEMDFCIFDEAHVLYKYHIKLMQTYDNVCFIGLSATPFTRGLGRYFSNLVVGSTTQELIEQKFLVPSRVFAPSTPDLSKVKIQAGDYQKKQLGLEMNKPTLVADIVSTWLKRGENRQTLCFATNVAHSKFIAEQFKSYGVNAQHIDAYTDSDEREIIINDFKAGKVKMLVSVGVLTTGFDAPNASCLIFARPTKSLMLHIQQWGRGLRICEGKTDCLILDHAGNTERLGFATDPLPDRLDDGSKKERQTKQKELLPSVCPSCAFVKPPSVHECPCCGFAPERKSEVVTVEGELKEIKPKKEKFTKEYKQKFLCELVGYQRRKGYSEGWCAHTYRDKFGVWPNNLSRFPEEPGSATLKYIIHKNIKHGYSKKKKQKRQCSCGSYSVRISSGTGPHHKRADCNECGRMWWIGKGAA